jgi:hypothetical protein
LPVSILRQKDEEAPIKLGLINSCSQSLNQYHFSASVTIHTYSSAPVSTGNTSQDLLRLCETADDTERYIYHDIRVTNINTAKFNDKQGLSEHKHCDVVATNANSENARSSMEACSAGKHEYRGKERCVKYWACLGSWISPCYGSF